MTTRGAIPVLVLWVAGLLAASQAVPNWRLSHLFAPAPPTKELVQAQADAAKAKAEAETARAELLANKAAQATKVQELTRSGQQMIAGIPEALKDEPQTAGVKLAVSLAHRAGDRLTAAIGSLPAELQAEILEIVADAKSNDAIRIKEAEDALAASDRELEVTTAAKLALEKQLPALQATVKAKDDALADKDRVVVQKTGELVTFTEKLVAKEKEAGSLGALVNRLLWGGAGLAFLYVMAHFILPSLAAEFPAFKSLTIFNQVVKSVTSAHL